MKRLSIALALIGVLGALFLLSYFGFDNVVSAAGRIGWGEFALIVVWQLVLFVILGLAWDAILPRRVPGRAWIAIWGRMVRDAATNCLPFSQVGGFVFGARAVTLHGVPWHTATASTVVDITAEFLAQIAFTALGLGILLARAPNSALAMPLEIGIGLAVLAAFAFVWLQKGAAPLFARLASRIARNRLGDAQDRMETLQAEMALIYGHTGKLALGFMLHLIGWIGTGVAGWIAYRALGVPIAFDSALAIEALLAAIAALSFLVPVNAGVQEAGYAGLGAIFGVPAELSLAVSLIRRARDIVVGVPILLLWQYAEVRRLRTSKQTATAGR
ncbi:lysylphosphatidylglycerol synthase domain-containing protein [Rhodopila sp.]|jgi:putative membrane protein|uniref:lysylphosphatidylglycerol synthase domain-containing protein n=1 Tax=Rhodopila sp. TaxID=2480087 RepID=UPI002C036304|nr:lysylphosphatidylglycerol synthase domain-containing protein [Rhodopila sp.]HVZ07364.1 lysylphosphatidylglycerol synthase domain-containing protein [Rhodopila sp.]